MLHDRQVCRVRVPTGVHQWLRPCAWMLGCLHHHHGATVVPSHNPRVEASLVIRPVLGRSHLRVRVRVTKWGHMGGGI